jgi:hypothetical protein
MSGVSGATTEGLSVVQGARVHFGEVVQVDP